MVIDDIPVWGKVLSAVVYFGVVVCTVIVNTMRVRIDKKGLTYRFAGRVKFTHKWGDIDDITVEYVYLNRTFHSHYKYVFKADGTRFAVLNTKRFAKLLVEYSKDNKSFSKALKGALRRAYMDDID